MKGILSKTYTGWKVVYVYPEGTRFLPLHPDDIPTQAEDHFWIDGKEVDFEIVDEIIDLGRHGSTVVEKAKLIFQTKPGFVEKRMSQMLEHLANEEFKNVGDEGLFPNHTDKDIWIAGFKAGYLKK